MKDLSDNFGQGKPISGYCSSDADFDKVKKFAEDRMSNLNREPYRFNPFNPNHCKTFARDAVAAGQTE